MNNTENMFQAAGETIQHARQYLEQQGDLIRLEVAERLAKVSSALVTFFVLSIFAILFFSMLSIAGAFWLSKLLGSYEAAFLTIAFVHALLGALVYLFRRRLITNPSVRAVLEAFFEKDKN
jgi:pilus assembly protein TadC